MPDKYMKLSDASNPLVHGDDGWKFATAQFPEVCDSKLMTSQARGTSAEERARKAAGKHVSPTAKVALSDIVVLIEVVDPSLDLIADFRQTRHRLCRRKVDEFLGLGGREAFQNEVALQDLFPTLAATGPFHPNGLAGGLTSVRAVRRCGFVYHFAVLVLISTLP